MILQKMFYKGAADLSRYLRIEDLQKGKGVDKAFSAIMFYNIDKNLSSWMFTQSRNNESLNIFKLRFAAQISKVNSWGD